MRNFSDKRCRENQNMYFVFNNFFFENNTIFGLIWKNTVEPGSQQVKIWRMRIACWAPTSTNAHPEHVTLIAFLIQQFLHDRA
jgi:hypothetical protein